jgi:hypothetical protein
MTTWKGVLRVKHLWKAHRDGEMTTYQLAQAVAKKLRTHYPDTDATDDTGWLEDIIEMFEELPEDATDDDFNIAYDELCDWGDQDHRLWIATF